MRDRVIDDHRGCCGVRGRQRDMRQEALSRLFPQHVVEQLRCRRVRRDHAHAATLGVRLGDQTRGCAERVGDGGVEVDFGHCFRRENPMNSPDFAVLLSYVERSLIIGNYHRWNMTR